MHRFTCISSAALSLAVLSSLPLGGAQTLLTGWDFSPLSDVNNETGIQNWDIGYVADMPSIQAYSMHSKAGFQGRLYWNGEFGSTSFGYTGYDDQVIGVPGSMLNVNPIGDQGIPAFSTQDTPTSNEALGFWGANGSFVITLPSTGYGDLQLSYAARRSETGEGSATNIAWSYSTDGSNYMDAGVVNELSTGGFAVYSADFSAIAALDNKSRIFLRGTISGASGVKDFNTVLAIDNIQVSGNPVDLPPSNPFVNLEPGVWGAVAGWGWNWSEDPAGWVMNQTLGWIYVASYPWIYSNTQGYLYAQEGGDLGTSGRWFFSQTQNAWLFTSTPFGGWFYNASTGQWGQP